MFSRKSLDPDRQTNFSRLRSLRSLGQLGLLSRETVLECLPHMAVLKREVITVFMVEASRSLFPTFFVCLFQLFFAVVCRSETRTCKSVGYFSLQVSSEYKLYILPGYPIKGFA